MHTSETKPVMKTLKHMPKDKQLQPQTPELPALILLPSPPDAATKSLTGEQGRGGGQSWRKKALGPCSNLLACPSSQESVLSV